MQIDTIRFHYHVDDTAAEELADWYGDPNNYNLCCPHHGTQLWSIKIGQWSYCMAACSQMCADICLRSDHVLLMEKFYDIPNRAMVVECRHGDTSA